MISKRKKRSVFKCSQNSYTIEQKKQVINYAMENGRNEAARHFNLNNSMVGQWIKSSEKWVEKNQNIKRVGSGLLGKKNFILLRKKNFIIGL